MRIGAANLVLLGLLLVLPACFLRDDDHVRDGEVSIPGLSHAVLQSDTYPLDLGTYEIRHRRRSGSGARRIEYRLSTSHPNLEWETPSGTLEPGEAHRIRLFLTAFLTGEHLVHLRLEQDYSFSYDADETWTYRIRIVDAAAGTMAAPPEVRFAFVPVGAEAPVVIDRLAVTAPTAGDQVPFRIATGQALRAEPARGELAPGATLTTSILAQDLTTPRRLDVLVNGSVRTVLYRDVAPRLRATLAQLAAFDGSSLARTRSETRVAIRHDLDGVAAQAHVPLRSGAAYVVVTTPDATNVTPHLNWQSSAEARRDYRIAGDTVLARDTDGVWRVTTSRAWAFDGNLVLFVPASESGDEPRRIELTK